MNRSELEACIAENYSTQGEHFFTEDEKIRFPVDMSYELTKK